MKHTLALIGIAGLVTLAVTSASFAQKGDETKEKTKTRHIKMTKIENGKKMELDTIIAGNDVFVWKGDTIVAKEMAKRISSEVVGKMKHIKVIVDGDDKDGNVMIYHMKDGKKGEPMELRMESGDKDEILTEESGDSIHKRIIIRKRMRDMNDFRNDAGMRHFPGMPPMMHMKMMKEQHAGRIIDLNDPNIISYHKKSLKGGREKIEIIRNKADESQEMNFNYNFNENLGTPEPPEAPEAPNFKKELGDDQQRTKIIEKDVKVNGKDGKEIKVEVETPDQK